ncbi:acyltransferase [Microbacterium sp. NPDC089189]|uniref:acyltransferase family protein n=1 Tax=Microbacterium sp. NPDC089189 TaxID=3154972 RepID=UPI003431BF86
MTSALRAPFPYRRNSLNLFRLVLAALVLYAHAFYLAGMDGNPSFNGEHLGGWAVSGFFVISGFLITRSRFRTSAGSYLVHRIARIFPAFLACLVVTAFVFAPVALVMSQGDLDGFLSTAPTPLQYVWGNIALYVKQYSIGATLTGIPYPDAWNGSLWTLYFEFFCYSITWVLGFLAIYRRSVVAVGIVWVLGVLLRVITGAGIMGGLDDDFAQMARLFPFFAGGALIYMVVDRWGLDRRVGIACIPIAGALMVFVPTVGGQLAAPALAYALLFLSTVIPQPGWIARNDVSYGFYIYAWPVQQLTVVAGALSLGFPAYLAITALITFGLAWLSWVLVERPIMMRVRSSGERPGDIQPVAAPSALA